MKTFLEKGHRLGIIASTDGHFGNPGYSFLNFRPYVDPDKVEIGKALIAVYAKELTRKEVFSSIYNRHAYATTGERIILDFRVNDSMMGSEIKSETAPDIKVEVTGTNTIEKIILKRDTKVMKEFSPMKESSVITWTDEAFQHGETHFYYVQIIQSDGEEAISSPVWVN